MVKVAAAESKVYWDDEPVPAPASAFPRAHCGRRAEVPAAAAAVAHASERGLRRRAERGETATVSQANPSPLGSPRLAPSDGSRRAREDESGGGSPSSRRFGDEGADFSASSGFLGVPQFKAAAGPSSRSAGDFERLDEARARNSVGAVTDAPGHDPLQRMSSTSSRRGSVDATERTHKILKGGKVSRMTTNLLGRLKSQRYVVGPARGENELKRTRLIAEVSAVRKRLQRNNKYVVSPNDNFIRQWDIVTFLALLFTAIVTPAEVAFLDGDFDALWVINRGIDLIFIMDICMQFFIGYKDPKRGNVFINDRALIAKRYMKSWFWIDCVSTFPIDVVAFIPGLEILERFRAIRLLKLLKLGRIGRVKRMMERWEVYAVFAVSYAEMSMYKSTILLIMYAHWTACLWGVVAHPMLVGDDAWTWKHSYELKMTDPRIDGGKHYHIGNARHTYLASLYMAVYTMTGIGYGDITPTNQPELAMMTCVMILSAVFWAFMIGNFCSLVSTINVHESVFRARMDNLNSMMHDRKFPSSLRRRCRMFLLNSKQHQRASTYPEIENYFSLSLRGEVAATSNEEWIKKVWYLRAASKDFIIELSQSLGTMMFAPMEAINVAYTLFILQAGIAARKGQILSKGSVWGADFIVRETDLIDRTCAASLSYTMVLCIGREHILEILENDDFDHEYVEIVKAANFYCFKTLMVRFGRQMLNRRKANEKNIGFDTYVGAQEKVDRRQTETLTERFQAQAEAYANDEGERERAVTIALGGHTEPLDGTRVNPGGAEDASKSSDGPSGAADGDDDAAAAAPRKPMTRTLSKRTILNRMSVTKLPIGYAPRSSDTRPLDRAPLGFIESIAENDDSDDNDDEASTGSVQSSGSHARRRLKPLKSSKSVRGLPSPDSNSNGPPPYDDEWPAPAPDSDEGGASPAARPRAPLLSAAATQPSMRSIMPGSMQVHPTPGPTRAGRFNLRPATMEENVKHLTDTVGELAACLNDLTEFLPKSFARLERRIDAASAGGPPGRGSMAGRARQGTNARLSNSHWNADAVNSHAAALEDARNSGGVNTSLAGIHGPPD